MLNFPFTGPSRLIVSDSSIADTPNNTYIVTTPPKNLAVPVRDVKMHLRLPLADLSQDAYIASLIRAATQLAEQYTARVFITTGFQTYRDFFPPCITLRRSKLQEILKIEYLVDGITTILDPSKYYTTADANYSSVYATPQTSFPLEVDCRRQAVTVDFTSGYGKRHIDVPEALRMGVLNHVAMMWADRGDCSGCGEGSLGAIPATSKAMYSMYSIPRLIPMQVC